MIYAGAEYYRDKGFETNSYVGLQFGSQLFQWGFLAPEVGFDAYFGSPAEMEFNYIGEANSIPEAKLKTQFSSYFFSITPKLKFGNEEAALVILPQYNIGKVSARGDYLVYNGNLYALEDREKVSGNQSFWSIAVGVEGQIFDVDHLWFSLFLKYTLLNSEEIIEELGFPDQNFDPAGGSSDGIGVGFRVYYDLFSAL
ncbi:hypothetical protein C8P64_2420 [Christiangramia gaetbulicola]|uniref:Outer membrane protein with beta-barrel domain n=1 Tax=Christiangramia gaetbulicola TaxID=703340 RepID=A0A2T6ADZ5_9FLAO|nr:hypothetical protein [Christiangramia gaetbulicola]PTX42006.1 hypothetical protein C8P64_2420 [Christiangramia gaetbulicola]